MARRSGTWFDPELVRAFEAKAAEATFWDALASPQVDRLVFELEPAQDCVELDDDYLDDIAAAFEPKRKSVAKFSPSDNGRERVLATTRRTTFTHVERLFRQSSYGLR